MRDSPGRFPRSPTELRDLAQRARLALPRPHDPADREQLRYFAEWFEREAEARERGAETSAFGEALKFVP
jgi:hypothetical protein